MGCKSMKEWGEMQLAYTANGKNPALSLVAQGGFSAVEDTLSNGAPCIRIKAPGSFSNGMGKIMAFFTFPATGSPVIVVKTLDIIKED